ncbi:GNAT family N-acetyltransferase [Actinobacillus succinogenes]|uniref:GCN5-related N-acetyltransferase n=1 Tax=Actinobacillus succinogenes (strain ATCC 55618 / DSM 22257 / CCUG 43843 / 130Z) TaxID=339671 RepID=A6VN78_ACTSZ|nr:GNAT family N-acetyltransferase [Actinobacillus succinogenes]ABR74425.1 GCN5-related N-acetyltransferase [Actinobacillus succinogenes 130Z]PHI41154.1 GNAT family N-acetyltransferase [Actinobacillus succinogenes]
MWQAKTLQYLTALELWKIYRLRVSVFVVEQNCPYQEVDELDKSAVHFWREIDGEIRAYCRIIDAADSVKIGRVIVAKPARGTGLGRELMANAIALGKNRFPNKPIYVQAQAYLQQFYTSFGFKAISGEYLEDGIPHLDMIL